MTTAIADNPATAQKSLSYEEERGKPIPSYNHSWIQCNLIAQFIKAQAYRCHSELTLEIQGERYTPDISLYPRSAPIVKSCWAVTPPAHALSIYSADGAAALHYTSGMATDPNLGIAVDVDSLYR